MSSTKYSTNYKHRVNIANPLIHHMNVIIKFIFFQSFSSSLCALFSSNDLRVILRCHTCYVKYHNASLVHKFNRDNGVSKKIPT